MTDPTPPTFTITDAATVCAVSRKTVTRRIPQLAAAGAYKDAAGAWVIPVGALIEVGLRPGKPAPPDRVPRPRDAGQQTQEVDQGHDDRAGYLEQLAELRLEMAELRRRAEVAEALAAERAERITDLRLALRQLEVPAPNGVPDEPGIPTPADPQQQGSLFGSVRRWLIPG